LLQHAQAFAHAYGDVVTTDNRKISSCCRLK
jgi:hypothetical protein